MSEEKTVERILPEQEPVAAVEENPVVASNEMHHCRWCGEVVEASEEKTHEKLCDRKRGIKNHPVYRHLLTRGKEWMGDEASERVLDIIKKFLEQHLFSLFLTVSIVASAAVSVTGLSDHPKTEWTAAEIRAGAVVENIDLPGVSEEPAPPEELAGTEQGSIQWSEIEMLNFMLFDYMDAAYYAQNEIPAEKTPDAYMLEYAVGTISDFTPVHDYVTYGGEYFAHDLDALSADQYDTGNYFGISAADTHADPITTLTYETELSRQLLSEGFRVIEYVYESYLMIDEIGETPEEFPVYADEYLKYVFVVVEVDGAWYVASDYLVERRDM